MRGRVCLLYMLLALASVVFLGSESLRTRDHILLSQIWDFPFRRFLRLAESRWRYSNPSPHGFYVSSVSHPFKTILRRLIGNTLSKDWVYPLSGKWHLSCAGNVCLGWCEINCLPSRYNGNASALCLGNDPSIPAFRHFVTLLPP
jgi:hypothetical protein